MKVKIQLSIQEVVEDFEHIIRLDEHMNNLLDSNSAEECDVRDFDNALVEIAEKYIPNYKKHLPETSTGIDHALELYKLLYENFREIFYRLV